MITPYSKKRSVINKDTGKSEQKTDWITKSEEREDFLKQFGSKRELGEKRLEELAKNNPKFVDMVLLPFPPNFDWIINHFLKIWRHCETDINGNRIFTPRQIMDYCQCFGVNINYHERQLIMKMKEWAVEAIASMKQDQD